MLKRKGDDKQPLELLGFMACLFGNSGPWRNQCGCENQYIISLLTATAGIKEKVCGPTLYLPS